MKKLLKNIICFALASTMFATSTVFAYTTDEIIEIQKKEETSILYYMDNPDLEIYVTKSDAEQSNDVILTYDIEEKYVEVGNREGRRAGLEKAMKDHYNLKFPKPVDATKEVEKLKDDGILKENKISGDDENSKIFLDAYKEGFKSAYSLAEYQLAGFDFGKQRAEKDLLRFLSYETQPSIEKIYSSVEKTIFEDYGVKSTDTYADDFKMAFREGYEITYLNQSIGSDSAYQLGKIAGYEKAKEIDFNLESHQDYKEEIQYYVKTTEYRINRAKILGDLGTNKNADVNINAYDNGFIEGANGYSGGAVSSENFLFIEGEKAGSDQASNAGANYAQSDYIKNRPLNEELAYNEYINNVDLYNKYKLYLMPKEYVDGFNSKFEIVFKARYIAEYTNRKNDTIKATQYIQLPSEGDLEATTNIGARLYNLAVDFMASFEVGDFYDESFITIYDSGRSLDHNKSRYTAYSNIITVDVYNDSTGNRQNFIKLESPLEISFDLDTGENVGVYKIIGDQYRYMHTEVEGSIIYATVDPGKYFGGSYVLLVDEKLPKVKDIANDWNFKGLDTYSRRGWLPVKNNEATPSKVLTREELAFMIERNLNKYNKVVEKPVEYADEDKFGGYNNAVNYVVANGYLTVDSKNNFRPKDKVTYQDFETVLSRALNSKVSFSTYDKYMISERFHKSDYDNGKKNYITKSEAVYTLLRIFK